MMVLAGGPARETGSGVFRLHKESLERQNGFDVETRHLVVPDPGGERWTATKVESVALARQKMLDMVTRYVGPRRYSALLMVDTDVILGPDVLKAMWEVDADVVYGVFWTVWPGWEQPMPQVWDVHPYGHTRECMEALVRATNGGGEVEVYGGGACTLFRGRAFESRYWPLMPGLVRSQGGMWAGEDRHYCIGLEARGIKQVALVGQPIVHLYTPEMQTPEALQEARELVGL